MKEEFLVEDSIEEKDRGRIRWIRREILLLERRYCFEDFFLLFLCIEDYFEEYLEGKLLEV